MQLFFLYKLAILHSYTRANFYKDQSYICVGIGINVGVKLAISLSICVNNRVIHNTCLYVQLI